MVGTRPKNKFTIPHGTKIDLTGDSPPQKPKATKKTPRKKPAMPSISKKSTKSLSQSKQQPLRITPLLTVFHEEEQVQQPAEEDVLPRQNVDQLMEEQDGEEVIEEAAGEATEDDALSETTVAESKEKGPDSTPAKSIKRAALSTPPAERQRAAPSDAGSSPTSGHGEEEEGEQTITPPVVNQEKPPRSVSDRQTRSLKLRERQWWSPPLTSLEEVSSCPRQFTLRHSSN